MTNRPENDQRPEVQRLAAHDLVVLPRLAQVDRERDDLGVVLVLDPLEHDAGVEPAAIEQQHAPDLAGLGQIAGDPGRIRARDAVDFGVGGGISGLVAHVARQPRTRPRAPTSVHVQSTAFIVTPTTGVSITAHPS